MRWFYIYAAVALAGLLGVFVGVLLDWTQWIVIPAYFVWGVAFLKMLRLAWPGKPWGT